MTGNIVARRYAKALYSLGRKQGPDAPAAFGKDLDALAGVLEEAPLLLRVFANPIVTSEEKKAVLSAVAEKLKLSDVVRNFLGLLADKERLSSLLDIAAYYRLLLDADQGIMRGELVTAMPLAAPRQETIKKRLEKQSGKKLVLSFGVDKAILGGVLLKIGDKVLDASLRAQLEILKEQIKRGD